MNGLHDLLTKLQSIEEAAKKSDIPAAQRKAKNPEDWKVTQQDLDKEEHEGKISHSKELAKNSGRTDENFEEGYDDQVSDSAPEQSDVATVAQAGNAEQGGAGASDESMEECGGDDMGGGGGNISMSMHDLLALMNHLQGKGHDHDQPLMGDERDVAEKYGNSVQGDDGPVTEPVAAVTNPPSNDMFTKGKEAKKVNGGGNPMEEALAELYADVKARQLDELNKDTLASYVRKGDDSVRSLARKTMVGGTADQKQKFYDKTDAKIDKRLDGMTNAVKKMSLKEANQLARQLRRSK